MPDIHDPSTWYSATKPTSQTNRIWDARIRQEFSEMIPIARSIAAKVGPLHGGWDCIFDAEAFVRGEPMTKGITVQDVTRGLQRIISTV